MQLRGRDTLGRFFAIFFKGDNFCDFQFACLNPLPKRGFSKRVGLFSKKRHNVHYGGPQTTTSLKPQVEILIIPCRTVVRGYYVFHAIYSCVRSSDRPANLHVHTSIHASVFHHHARTFVLFSWFRMHWFCMGLLHLCLLMNVEDWVPYTVHYVNMPIQICWKFCHQKMKKIG